MANHRLYPFWGILTEALRTGQPQNEVEERRPGHVRDALCRSGAPEEFLAAMTGISHGANMAIAREVPVERTTRRSSTSARRRAIWRRRSRSPIRTCAGIGFDLPEVGADLRGVHRGERRGRPRQVRRRQLLRSDAAQGRRRADGPHPARLGSADQEDADQEGV